MGGSFGGMVKGGCLPGIGEWTCLNCGETDCWSTRYNCYSCGGPRYFDESGMGQGHFSVGPGKGGSGPGFQGRRVGAGMSGALGRDQTCVSVENRTHRKGGGRRGGGGEASVPGAGVGSGRNRLRFQENSEDVSRAGVLGGVGAEVPGAAPMGQGRTQRELILEAVEALKTLLGQGVWTRVVGLIQKLILPPPQVTPQAPRLNGSVLNNLPSCLRTSSSLRKVFRRGWRGSARPGGR